MCCFHRSGAACLLILQCIDCLAIHSMDAFVFDLLLLLLLLLFFLVCIVKFWFLAAQTYRYHSAVTCTQTWGYSAIGQTAPVLMNETCVRRCARVLYLSGRHSLRSLRDSGYLISFLPNCLSSNCTPSPLPHFKPRWYLYRYRCCAEQWRVAPGLLGGSRHHAVECGLGCKHCARCEPSATHRRHVFCTSVFFVSRTHISSASLSFSLSLSLFLFCCLVTLYLFFIPYPVSFTPFCGAPSVRHGRQAHGWRRHAVDDQ